MCDKKKLLVLGGKPIGSIELVELNLYVIVTDFLPEEQSPAKRFADESWNISTSEIDILEELCKKNHIDGILTAVHEFNINQMLNLCERLNKPCYCNRSTWLFCDNKLAFKSLCEDSGIPVAKKYDISISDEETLSKLIYPLIVKPVDGSGSRGFSICYNVKELVVGYNKALGFSGTQTVVVEDFIPYDAVIIHYTMNKGFCYYSGMSDKFSARFKSTGASVMGLQTFPSKGESIYLETLNDKVCTMFEKAGFVEGPIWIEAFFDGKDKFIFNEMGYRFGGSLTNYPVKYFYNIDQLDMMISIALGESLLMHYSKLSRMWNYCILPIHIKEGRITSIKGVDEIKAREDVYAYVPVHYLHDEIKDWGSAQQVFCYLHILYFTKFALKQTIEEILSSLKVFDEERNNMLYTLYDLNNLK